jgi:hypothetical protein
MSEKVRLPKEVCDALDKVKKEFLGYSFHQIVNRLIDEDSAYKSIKFFNYYNADTIYRVLVMGYEPELSAEELMKEVYFLPYEPEATPETMEEAFKEGVRTALDIHGIHYDWMEDAE